jgi:hypothetical protein
MNIYIIGGCELLYLANIMEKNNNVYYSFIEDSSRKHIFKKDYFICCGYECWNKNLLEIENNKNLWENRGKKCFITNHYIANTNLDLEIKNRGEKIFEFPADHYVISYTPDFMNILQHFQEKKWKNNKEQLNTISILKNKIINNIKFIIIIIIIWHMCNTIIV